MRSSHNSIASEPNFYRRRLPHLRSDFVIYFVTWRIHADADPLRPEERSVVADALDFFHDRRYALLMYVVMDDHVHLLVRLFPNVALAATIHSWKSFTAHRLVKEYDRAGTVWQHELFDRVMRNTREIIDTHDYIRNNPFKKWPELEGTAYPWLKVRPEFFPSMDA